MLVFTTQEKKISPDCDEGSEGRMRRYGKSFRMDNLSFRDEVIEEKHGKQGSCRRSLEWNNFDGGASHPIHSRIGSKMIFMKISSTPIDPIKIEN